MAHPADKGDILVIRGQDAAHIGLSLRSRLGDRLVVCDGRSTEYPCKIVGITREEVRLEVEDAVPSRSEPGLFLTLYQGLPKSDKMDRIVQKAVELGVSRIVPVKMERSVARITGNAEQKLRRWQTVSREAAQQSGRGIVPEVLPPISSELLAQNIRREFTVVCYEGGGEPLSSLVSPDTRSLSLVTGPEGGISLSEIESFMRAGARTATLGPRILRCETAPLAAVAVMMSLTGNLS